MNTPRSLRINHWPFPDDNMRRVFSCAAVMLSGCVRSRLVRFTLRRRERHRHRSDRVGAAIENNQTDGLCFLRDGNILNDFNALLQHFVMVLSVEMEVERNHWPTLRLGALDVADDGEPQLSVVLVPFVNQNDIVGADVRVEVYLVPAFRIARKGRAETDFGGVERSRDG